MLKVQELKELIRAFDQSNVGELSFEQDQTKITLKKQSQSHEDGVTIYQPITPAAPAQSVEQVNAPAPASTPAKEEEVVKEDVADENTYTITSPMVGTFYAAPAPDADPYVKKGDQVKEDTVVCIVEAMKLMNEIEADADGEVIKILAQNGELVEYGQPLFVVKLSE